MASPPLVPHCRQATSYTGVQPLLQTVQKVGTKVAAQHLIGAQAYGEADDETGQKNKSKRKYAVGRVTLRTLFFDEHVLSAVREGAKQVVLLGAGMDCRAWRLDLPAGEGAISVLG